MKPANVVGKLLRALLGLWLLLLGFAGFFTCAATTVEYPVVAPQEGVQAWPRGAFHVHTTRSDGRGTVEGVAAAARAAGLQFVVLTDHNDFGPREPAFVDGVLMIPGVEISTSTGHLVAFGMQTPLDGPRARQEGVSAVEAAGGVSVLAHPVQKKNPWTDPEGARRARGFELYSADTFFRDAVRSPFSRLIPAVGATFANAMHGVMLLVTPQPASTERLLKLTRERPRLALCSHDAHGLPRYREVFLALALYLPPTALPEPLSTEPGTAAAQVLRALSSGQAVCAFRGLGEPMGFALEGPLSEQREARVGDVLTIRLPAHEAGKVRVEVSGAGRLRPDGTSIELVEEGAVQIEAWVLAPGRFFGSEWRPWIVPSPIRVLPRGSGG
jgi:hypothetical protein